MRSMVIGVVLWIGLTVTFGQSPQPAQAGASFRDCADCPEMVMIPAGRFLMGTAADEEAQEALDDAFRRRSDPRREVAIEAFAAGKFEVTRGQYRVFAEATSRAGDGCFIWTGERFDKDPAKDWRNPGYAQNDQHPVTCVSWEDATAYTRWLSQRTGRRYRLLSEAEWEYAARGGTTATRYWGDDGHASCSHGNGADFAARAGVPGARDWPIAQCDDRHAYTAPGGSYRANGFGLHDMLGNVWEWTEDCWNPNYRDAPTDGSAWLSGECDLRAVRGGSWEDAPAGVRAAYRVGSPVVIRVFTRGFRVAQREIGREIGDRPSRVCPLFPCFN